VKVSGKLSKKSYMYLKDQPKGYRASPLFETSIPEWQEAKRLNDLANDQARNFGLGLQKGQFLFMHFSMSKNDKGQ